MFSEKKKNSGNGASKQPNRLGKSTSVNGDITSEEDFRIDGNFEGNLTTSGKLVVGESGVLKGNISASNAEILGKVYGELIVKELLSIKSTAYIEGKVTTDKLSIEPGAVFNAVCEMQKKGHPSNKNERKKEVKA